MKVKDRLLRESDVIRIVDKHTKDDGSLGNDISCILEELKEPWIKCVKGQMPEDMSCYKNRKVIDVLITTKYGKVTKVQRVYNEWAGNKYWSWGRIHDEPKAWMSMPGKYEGK